MMSSIQCPNCGVQYSELRGEIKFLREERDKR